MLDNGALGKGPLGKGPLDPAPRQDLLNAALIIIGVTLLGILAVATAFVACDGPPVERGNPGHVAAEQHLHSYVDALNANDARRLGEFLGEPADSPDVRDRLKHLGGKDLTDLQVTVSSEFANTYRAWVKARSGSGDQVSFYEVLAWEDGRWDFAPFVTPAPS